MRLPVSLWTTILLWKIASILKVVDGVAGTIFVHKILGHAARVEGKSLAETQRLGRQDCSHIHTIGLALAVATVPEVGKPGFVPSRG